MKVLHHFPPLKSADRKLYSHTDWSFSSNNVSQKLKQFHWMSYALAVETEAPAVMISIRLRKCSDRGEKTSQWAEKKVMQPKSYNVIALLLRPDNIKADFGITANCRGSWAHQTTNQVMLPKPGTELSSQRRNTRRRVGNAGALRWGESHRLDALPPTGNKRHESNLISVVCECLRL